MKVSFSSLFLTESSPSTFKFTNDAMQEALKKAKEAKQVQVAEAAASLLGSVERRNNLLLQELRQVRKRERQLKENLEKFTESAEYFMGSGNFGPLYSHLPIEVSQVCNKLGVDLPTADEQKIPEKKS